METSVISNKPMPFTKPVANDGQRQQTAEQASVPTAADSLNLSDQALQLARSTKLQSDKQVPVIENPQQAKLMTQTIVEQLRQQSGAEVGNLVAAHAGSLKSLLA